MLREETLQDLDAAVEVLEREGYLKLSQAVEQAHQMLLLRLRLTDEQIIAHSKVFGVLNDNATEDTVIAFARSIMKRARA
jgi:hypothetical protein